MQMASLKKEGLYRLWMHEACKHRCNNHMARDIRQADEQQSDAWDA